ncbi:MAG: folylpolyglutamate synthase/dihydrofolate synthase family protein [Ginsengibacter sp.]
MTYEQTLHYLYNKLPVYSSIGRRAYKADLTNTIALCDFLQKPQDKIKTIHVAGTNGKGSTSHMIAAIFQQAGYKTGLYTSPHLKDFRERIKINGQMISQDFVVDFVAKIKAFSEEIEPSFFELTFVMALEYFATEKVDIAIIETGLGGRLDSTNVITPVLSIITNIAYDHMDILGDTLEKIAYEKAGIIKPNVPVVIGDVLPGTRIVFEGKSKETVSQIVFAQETFTVMSATNEHNTLEVVVKNKENDLEEKYTLDLPALYQQKNLLTVLTSINILRNEFKINDADINTGLLNVKNYTGLHGRWEIINDHPKIVLDVAHNEDGIKNLVNQINHTLFSDLHIVFGMVKDKEIEKVLYLLPQSAKYYFTKSQIARALPEDELLLRAKKFDLNGTSFAEVNKALEAAMITSSRDDLIIVCGSVFIVGEVNFPG